MTTLRLAPSERFAGALWGILVAGAGVVCIAVYSGYTIDLELLGIGVLAAAGLWLMASAIAGGMSRRRNRASTSGPALAYSARATAQSVTGVRSIDDTATKDTEKSARQS